MNLRQKNGKWDSLKILALFRFLLWWGAEMARQVFIYKKPRAQIVRMSKVDRFLPISFWAFTRDETYCLLSHDDCRRVEIYPVSEMKSN